MPKEDAIEVSGIVKEKFPNGMFSVDVDGRIVLVTLGGKLRLHKIKILVGDKVTCELSPYDLSKGRITFRNR